MADEASRVLHYWHTVEALTAAFVPDIQRHPRHRVADLTVDTVLPWDPERAPCGPADAGCEWRFTVYGGLFELDAVHQALVERLGDDRVEVPPRTEKRSALFCFALDASGDVVPGSTAVSKCAWAARSVLGQGGEGLDGWEREQNAFSAELDRLADRNRPASTGAERPREPDLRERAARRVGEAGRAALGEGAKATGALAGAAATAVAGPLGAAAGTVLGPVVAAFVEKLLAPRAPDEGAPRTGARHEELDVASLTRLVERLVDALGRGAPDATGIRVEARQVAPGEDHPTFLNGFLAADLAVVRAAERRGDLGEALGTYLRLPTPASLSARIDLTRAPATVLSGTEPRHTPTARWPAPADRPLVLSQQLAVNHLLHRLAGGAGVLAVNGPPGTGKTTLLRDLVAAVVTDRARRLAELRSPADAFDRRRHTATFRSGTTMRFQGPKPDLAGFEIVLGTTTNAAAANVSTEIPAADAVDLAEHPGFEYFTETATTVLGAPAWGLVAAQLGAGEKRREFAFRFWNGASGMMQLLRTAEQSPDSVPAWPDAVSRFRTALAEVDRLVAERQPAAEARTRLHDLRPRVDELEQQLVALEKRRRRCAAERMLATHREDEARVAVDGAQRRLDDLTGPGVTVLLRRGVAAWLERRRQRTEQRGRLHALEADLDARRTTSAAAATALAETDAHLDELRDRLRTVEQELTQVTAVVEEARRRWGPHVPGPSLDAEAQRCAPWADAEIVRARTDVFLAALALHRAFLLGAAYQVRRSISVVVDLLRGNPVVVDDEARLAAWRTFFLVVPVVSTTFASLPGLFRGIGREAFGWLLVDEAGQSTPQTLTGGLWRCRRALVVGDQRQLEPVTPLPGPVRAALGRHAGVSAAWSDVASAQEVADRVTPAGAYLRGQGDSEQLWVGLPLRVHRRCDQPIFDAFSRMAYGPDLLVYGTETRPATYADSVWLHVPTQSSTGKWSKAEGAAVASLLDTLTPEVLESTMVLTPFRDIADHLRHHGDRVRRVGTVHTAQGQEADTVVLVLGTGHEDGRAREWLTEKPNLLNVALSRARRRVVVVGDHDLWSRYPYVDDLAAALAIGHGGPGLRDGRHDA